MRYTCSDTDCLCSNPPPPAPMSRPVATPQPLEVLGITTHGEIAYRFGNGDTFTLTADDLGVLAREIQRDTLPLWPTVACRFCGTDSVAVIDGDGYCRGHEAGYGMAEEASS